MFPNMLWQADEGHDLRDSCPRKTFLWRALHFAQVGVVLQTFLPLLRAMNGMLCCLRAPHIAWPFLIQPIDAKGQGTDNEWLCAPARERNADSQADVPRVSGYAATRGATFFAASNVLKHYEKLGCFGVSKYPVHHGTARETPPMLAVFRFGFVDAAHQC
jgi:hypothetical protein